MKLELTKEEMIILNGLCFAELVEMGKIRHNEFIDKVQVETYTNKIRILQNKLNVEG